MSFLRSLAASALLLSAAHAAAASLRIAVPNPIQNSDPMRVAIAQELFVLPMIYEQLFFVGVEGDLTPQLVDSWSFDADTRRLSMRLRAGHRFSDGSEVSSADVVASVKRICTPGSRSAGRLTELRGCGRSGNVGIHAVGPRTVAFEISAHPNAFLHKIIFAIPAIMKDAGDGRWIGSGPFQVERLADGNLTLAVNPHYHAPRQDAPARVEFVFVPERNIKKTLDAGAFDVVSMYLTSTTSDLEAPVYEKFEHAPYVTQILVLNPAKPAFSDPSVRKTLAAAISGSGLWRCRPGQTRAHGIIPQGIGGSIVPPKDAPKAPPVKIIRPATSVVLHRHAERRNSCEEEHIAKAMSAVGINVEWRYSDDYSRLKPRYSDPATDGYVELLVTLSRDASIPLRRFSSKAKEMSFFYTDPQIERLIDSAGDEGSITERFKIYKKINMAVVQHSSVIPLYYVGHTNYVKKSLVSDRYARISYNPNSFLFVLELTTKTSRR